MSETSLEGFILEECDTQIETLLEQSGVLSPADECAVSIDDDVCLVEEEQVAPDVFVSVSPQNTPCFSPEAGVDLEEVACIPSEQAPQGSEESLLQASAALALVKQGGQRTVTQTVARTAPRALAYSFETGEIISAGTAVETGAGLGSLEVIGVLGYGLIFLLPLIDIQDSPKEKREPVIPITGVDIELDPESDLDEDLDVDSFNDGVLYRDLSDPSKSWDEASTELAQAEQMGMLELEIARRQSEGLDTSYLEGKLEGLREAYARTHPSNQTIPSPQASAGGGDEKGKEIPATNGKEGLSEGEGEVDLDFDLRLSQAAKSIVLIRGEFQEEPDGLQIQPGSFEKISDGLEQAYKQLVSHRAERRRTVAGQVTTTTTTYPLSTVVDELTAGGLVTPEMSAAETQAIVQIFAYLYGFEVKGLKAPGDGLAHVDGSGKGAEKIDRDLSESSVSTRDDEEVGSTVEETTVIAAQATETPPQPLGPRALFEEDEIKKWISELESSEEEDVSSYPRIMSREDMLKFVSELESSEEEALAIPAQATEAKGKPKGAALPVKPKSKTWTQWAIDVVNRILYGPPRKPKPQPAQIAETPPVASEPAVEAPKLKTPEEELREDLHNRLIVFVLARHPKLDVEHDAFMDVLEELGAADTVLNTLPAFQADLRAQISDNDYDGALKLMYELLPQERELQRLIDEWKAPRDASEDDTTRTELLGREHPVFRKKEKK